MPVLMGVIQVKCSFMKSLQKSKQKKKDWIFWNSKKLNFEKILILKGHVYPLKSIVLEILLD